MVTCLKFLKNILAAEFKIQSKPPKSKATFSSGLFIKVGWVFCIVLILCKQDCMHASTQI